MNCTLVINIKLTLIFFNFKYLTMFIERGIFVISKYIFDHVYCKPDEWKHETISNLHVLVLFDLHLYYIIC